ncbi:AEC family transporter [Anaerorhabdus sp.]|uniref:AEC family transporter n=1 Tax=Anaerorhabdus sp. TaxID=1872524 RepID=UPI002B1FA80D|nr:AEC family transporter [Anaerorhabdus sp.]MEA4875919.1 AEC family transporter [Anaerorhabdus sp.]
MTKILMDLQIMILTYIAVGFILYKVKMIDTNAQNFLSKMTLNLLLPASVFVSFVENMSLNLITSLATILFLAIIIEIVLFIITKIPTRILNKQQASVAHYGYLVSNGGLIGTPVIEGLFGGLGVMYCNVFMIPTRIMAYSAGESVFNPKLQKDWKEIMMAIVTNKIILAMIIAIGITTFHLIIPSPCLSALKNIGACLSPVSLMLVGSMLAEKMHFDFKIFGRISLITMMRLVIIPVSVLLLCMLLKIDFQNTCIVTLLMGMPVGSTCAVFAKKYKGDESFASLTVFATTLLSSVTLVVLMKLMETVYL